MPVNLVEEVDEDTEVYINEETDEKLKYFTKWNFRFTGDESEMVLTRRSDAKEILTWRDILESIVRKSYPGHTKEEWLAVTINSTAMENVLTQSFRKQYTNHAIFKQMLHGYVCVQVECCIVYLLINRLTMSETPYFTYVTRGKFPSWRCNAFFFRNYGHLRNDVAPIVTAVTAEKQEPEPAVATVCL